MRQAWNVVRRAGLWLGPLLSLGSLTLDVLSVAQLGLPLWAFQAGGVVLFVLSACSIIVDQGKEIRALREQLDDRSRRRAIAERLSRFLLRGDVLTQSTRPDQWVGEFQEWGQEVLELLRSEGAAADAAVFAASRVPKHQRPSRLLHTAQWQQLDRMMAQMEVLEDIIARYRA